MNSIRTGLVAVAALVVAMSLMVAPAASADSDDDVVRDLQISYELDDEGNLHVTETFQWDFGDREGLGFYRSLVRRMGYEPDPSKERVLLYSDFAVESPSGAPAGHWREDSGEGPELVLAIGAPDGSSDTRTGVQTYVLSYDVEGAVNAVRDQQGVADADELFYNVFTDSPNRVDAVSVTVTGPASVTDVACYQGARRSTDACASSQANGDTATFSAEHLESGDGLTIMTAFAPGTFSAPGPILVDRPAGAQAADAVRDGWPIGAGVWAVVLAGLAGLRVWRGRDRAYAGLAPGVLPTPGTEYAEERLRAEPPIAARYYPPEGLRPAEAMVITNESVNDKAFTATMLDLAVRGYFSIEPAYTDEDSGEVDDWILTRNPQAPPRDRLMGYEQVVLDSLLGNRKRIRVSKLRDDFAEHFAKFSKALTAHSDTNGWFTRPGLAGGKHEGGLWWAIGVVGVGFFAALLSVIGGGPPWVLVLVAISAAVLSLLIVWIATRKAAHPRSGLGRAHYEQIRGFREHLSSVEGHQLRWETGHDIFSDYLPWAVAFGLTERWVDIFKQLADEDRYDLVPLWYVGTFSGYGHRMDSIGESVSGLESGGMAPAATPGSSGGSGSFSGGGFSGGGVGGGSFGGR